MKKITINKMFLSLLALFFVWNVTAQNHFENRVPSQSKINKKQEQVKKGWNIGALPIISFNSDLGFQYGALMNLYNYGDGSGYPNYRQSLYVEISHYTKNSGIYHINYDTKDLIKGIRVYFDMSYRPDRAYSFYGFNGYDAVYNPLWVTTGSPDYKTRLFYRYQRKFFSIRLDFQGCFKNKKLHWVAGLGLYNTNVAPVDVDLLNKGKSSDLLPYVPGLYDKYVTWGLIPASEKKGGIFTIFKVALEYDSRDNEANPNKGIWTEIVLVEAPKFASSMEDSFLKLSFTHRQYIGLVKDRLTFDYRIGGQITLAGHSPFYANPLLFFARSTGAGLGGSNTLRGVLRNRILGDGVMYRNFEFRWKFYKFHFINQNFYLAINTFFDTGTVIQRTDVKSPAGISDPAGYFKKDAEVLHNSAGLGIRIAMNQNFTKVSHLINIKVINSIQNI